MPRRESRQQPEFLVDRSLGTNTVPTALRDRGFVVHTLRSVYGEVAAQTLADEVWLRDAGKNGWIVLAKDERIRYLQNEVRAIEECKVKAFYLTSAGLKGDQQAEIFVNHVYRIIQRARREGPMIYAVTAKSLRQVL